MAITGQVSASSQPPSAVAPRRPDIQGLRAIAVLMVVAFHAGLPVPGGFVGVDVFFVISGFVITAMLHREWNNSGRISFGRFYLRRFKRLTPALALTVTFTMLISIWVLSPFGPQQNAAKTGLGAILLTANFVIARTTGGYFDVPAENNPLLNTWSLSVEEQFYLVFPALIALGWHIARRHGWLRFSPHLIVGSIAVASFALTLASASGVTFPGAGLILGFYSPFTRAWEFAVGALLALIMARWQPRAPLVMSMLGISGLLMLASSLWLITDGTPFPGPWTLLPVTGTLLLLLSGTPPTSPTSRILSITPMVKVGDWSYSIYLWHWPLIVFAAAIWPLSQIAVPIAAATSFVVAISCYYWVEQPLRNIVIPDRRRLVWLVAVTLGTPLACAMILGLGARDSWWLSWPTSSSQNDHVALQNCTDKPFDPSFCTFNEQLTSGSVLVAGDSQAYAAADAVIEAARMLDLSTVVSSRSGCPMLRLDTTGEKPLDCPTWQGQLVDFALETRPRVVVIVNRSAGYTNPGWRTLIAPDGKAANAALSDEVVPLYESALGAVVQEFRQAGIGVVILQNIPEPNELAASTSLLQRLLPGATPNAFNPGPSVAMRLEVAAAERRVAATNPGAVVVDPVTALCPDGPCPLTTDGMPIYLDPWHLSREGSLLLTLDLVDALKRAESS